MSNYEEFYNRLREKGFKLTPQRIIVADALVKHQNKHTTIEELFESIKSTNPNIGLTTVYRSVQIFCDLNLVEKVVLDDGIIRYELINETDVHKHHHLICNTCSGVIEVNEDLFDPIEKIFYERYGFKVSNHQANFYGLCKDCQEKIL